MPEHSLDLPLGALVAILVVKEAFQLIRSVIAKRNGQGAPSSATQLDVAQAEARIVAEVRSVSDTLHGRITDLGERVSRLEGGAHGSGA